MHFKLHGMCEQRILKQKIKPQACCNIKFMAANFIAFLGKHNPNKM